MVMGNSLSKTAAMVKVRWHYRQHSKMRVIPGGKLYSNCHHGGHIVVRMVEVMLLLFAVFQH